MILFVSVLNSGKQNKTKPKTRTLGLNGNKAKMEVIDWRQLFLAVTLGKRSSRKSSFQATIKSVAREFDLLFKPPYYQCMFPPISAATILSILSAYYSIYRPNQHLCARHVPQCNMLRQAVTEYLIVYKKSLMLRSANGSFVGGFLGLWVAGVGLGES